MPSYVLGFQEIDKTKQLLVGGKGLNLGELSRIEGIRVPEGFCVTTNAYKKAITHNEQFQALLEQLSAIGIEDREQIIDISQKIRKVIQELEIPSDIKEEVVAYLTKLGEKHSYAVRSSATAEDLPHASFAGQHDTYLNIVGQEAILRHICKCWASLFTERAIIYRMQNGFDHRKVYLSVIIQQMVFPQASGILFTADPLTSNRNVISIDASFGLGEALVSGLVSADNYKVRKGRIMEKTISTKKLAVYALKESGTQQREIDPDRQNKQTLTDEQILQLERIGRKIEAYFSCPQDIEWCLVEDVFYIVQSRPITTLYPIPDVKDGKNHVYLSFGHQQMMTDTIKPLGISFLRFLSGNVPFVCAGGRLFIDYTHDLASPIGRRIILGTMRKHEPLMYNAILSLWKRKDFMKSLPRGKRIYSMRTEGLSWKLLLEAVKNYRKNDAAIIQSVILETQESIRDLQQRIANVSGDELFAFILQDQHQLRKATFNPQGFGAVMAGVYAANWLNEKMEKWLGEKNVADTLSQSVPNNVTSEMGLELLDVSDVIRQYPAVMTYLEHDAKDETFFEDLARLEGGNEVIKALRNYLEKYGMRCPGEIDVTKPRWSEQPTALIPMIMSNIRNFEPNERRRKFEQGLLKAKQKEQELLSRLEQLPGGKRKAKKAKKMISVMRNFIGYREYPKYAFINRFYIYKQALLKEAERLVEIGVIQEKEDIYYLSFEELREVVRKNWVDYNIINKRKAEYEFYEKLTPPRILTSEGECIDGEYNTENIPSGALPGTAVSSGIIEGRARVILRMEDSDSIEDGDILVTAFTDPSWTPVFVSIKGLVTEVGGLMTHGSVIAREYGLPAVVGVENATKLIKDGQRIRVNGTDGYVELL